MSDQLEQALSAHRTGNLTEAERLYRGILSGNPGHADALALLGLVLDARGDPAQALELIEKAVRIDPRSALFHLHRGNVLMSAKRTKDAIAAFRQATLLQPGLAPAYYNLGNALRIDGDWTNALSAYWQAIQHQPDYSEAYSNLALVLMHEERLNDALQMAVKATEIAPMLGSGWVTLCGVAEAAKDYELSAKAGARAVQLLPNDNKAWFGYGVALNRLDRNEEAIEAYKRTLELDPKRVDIWDNLGQTYQAMNRLEEAEAVYRKTIEVAGQVIADEDKREVDEKEYGNRHWHLALLELLRGKLKEGFARYRARFKDVAELKRPDFPCPLWKGEDLKDKTILIRDEQGFGDTLMFCRYLPLLKAKGAHIIFAVHPVLKPLFEGWTGVGQVIKHGEQAPPFDCHASVFDLPHRFGTALDTIPADIPYLPQPAPDAVTQLENDGRRKVGVIWGGSPLHRNDFRRSIPLAVFADIFNETGLRFFSLNRDMRPGDGEIMGRYGLVDLVPRIRNFADSARFMRQLDLIITCDTATAHLAGGLGIPVWVLLPFAPDWRWLLDRSDSPWYPSLRLFRQKKPGDWKSVIAEVRQALKEF